VHDKDGEKAEKNEEKRRIKKKTSDRSCLLNLKTSAKHVFLSKKRTK
jgi:hypothetical protein